MSYTNRHFIKNFLEQHVKTNQLVIDGFAKEGQNTRFLASRVGKDGQVLSFHNTKEEANKTAASLFMAGLQERATIVNGALFEDTLKQELGRLTKVDRVVLDYMDDAVSPDAVDEALTSVWPYVKPAGTVLLSVKNGFNFVEAYAEELGSLGSSASFTAEDGLTWLFEKQSADD
ncbi:SAM-dependent methyltransferase [Fructobacillus sp. W13]|uniref:SAM-dependent methyltransferase n=1 Tax=Fructobacillus apis TaxID=2935017 RepID=A0ABT0ZNS4_9LACO|nr:SAM-dependent methyltransferase [Fructobacillus apis]MCO0831636.1 SAM-dependent methyltransferase [Fructobacillus apis]